MEYKIEKWEAMDLLMHAKDFHAETGETEIPKFWEEYYAHEEYRKIPGYLGLCAQQKTDSDEFRYGIGCKASDVGVGPTPKAIQAMWGKIYREWLPVSDYELIPDYDIENYLPGDPSSRNYISEICIPVRKK